MKKQDLKLMFEQMRAQGWNPQLCDTPVPYYENRVPCGAPTDVGDTVSDEFIMMPRDMVKLNMTFTVNAFGQSMRDAGINDGDILEVLSTCVACDGDIVVARIGEAFTVKGFYEDEYGRQWLVPCNTDGGYKPILLSGCEDAHIAGRVVSVRKRDPRAQHRMMHLAVTGCEDFAAPVTMTPAERMRRAVTRVAPMVNVKRQWYAVFRALVDKRALGVRDYDEFVQMLRNVMPGHPCLPVADELRRMEVQSFRLSVGLWDESDAPVTGARFDAYLRIANAILEVY